jgi:hypothetical protein
MIVKLLAHAKGNEAGFVMRSLQVHGGVKCGDVWWAGVGWGFVMRSLHARAVLCCGMVTF